MPSMSGRSSRSTFTLTNSSFINVAVAGSSNDSCAITWHQWHDEYPTDRNTGLSSARARSNASSPHGYQSTGLSRCWRRYGLVSPASRFTRSKLPSSRDGDLTRPAIVGFARRGADDLGHDDDVARHLVARDVRARVH